MTLLVVFLCTTKPVEDIHRCEVMVVPIRSELEVFPYELQFIVEGYYRKRNIRVVRDVLVG
jgi:hypothetical protein